MKFSKKQYMYIGALCLPLMLAVNEIAVAQQARLEEIVVTAERRETSLQDTPVVVAVTSAESLTEQGVNDFLNIEKVVPGVRMVYLASGTALSVRGLRSTSIDFADESPNAVHIDGNYMSNSRGLNGHFYDLARIETLKGPQGTLFGRNAASGAFNIITNKPELADEVSGNISLDVGAYNLNHVQAAANVPISDSVATRIAVNSLVRDGYFKSGRYDANQQGARIHTLFQPSDKQSLLVTLDAVREGGIGGPAMTVLKWDASENGPAPVPPVTSGAVPSDPYDDSDYYSNSNGDSRDVYSWGVSAEYNYYTDWATYTLQTSRRDLNYDWRSLGFERLNDTGRENSRVKGFANTNTTEFRVTSASDSSLDWVGGVFYMSDYSGGITETFDPAGPKLSDIEIPGTKSKAYAVFAQGTWTPEAMENLHLTLGGRYNRDEKTGNGSTFVAALGAPVGSPVTTSTFSKFNYKVGVAYDVSEDSMLFVNYATGFKSGGYVYGIEPYVQPQGVKNIEIGSRNQFMDNRLLVNIDLFRTKYAPFARTYGLLIPNPPSPIPIFMLAVTSTGGATVKGVESTVQYLLTDRDTFGFTLNYLNFRYDNLILPGIPLLGVPDYNADGETIENTPKFTGNVSYTHTFSLAGGELDASVFGQISGKRNVTGAGGTLGGVPYDQKAFSIWDLNFTYRPSSGNYSLRAYVNNVTDEWYMFQAGRYSAGGEVTSGLATGMVNPPRTYGVALTVNF